MMFGRHAPDEATASRKVASWDGLASGRAPWEEELREISSRREASNTCRGLLLPDALAQALGMGVPQRVPICSFHLLGPRASAIYGHRRQQPAREAAILGARARA